MPMQYSQDYLLDKQVKVFQPVDGYRASTDAVLLAAFVSSQTQQAHILDVGSGTGAVSLCLAQRLIQQNVTIFGAEIQPDLADRANMSAVANGFGFLQYFRTDIRQKETFNIFKPCSFDIVITNPPYSDHDLPSPNPSKATAHNISGGGLADWLAFCIKATKPFGTIYMINRAEALPYICSLLNGKAGRLTVLPIYSKSEQPAKRVIIAAQKDSKAPARLLPPFVVHDESGAYTLQAQKILRQGCGFEETNEIYKF